MVLTVLEPEAEGASVQIEKSGLVPLKFISWAAKFLAEVYLFNLYSINDARGSTGTTFTGTQDMHARH